MARHKRNYKDVWSDAYYEAEDAGKTPSECERIANEAVTEFMGNMADASEGDR